MPALAIYRSDTVTLDQYNSFRAALPLEAAPPDGLVHALARTANGALCVVEIWNSREALEAYNREVADDALRAAGLPVTAPEILEVETLAVTKGALPYLVETGHPRAAPAPAHA